MIYSKLFRCDRIAVDRLEVAKKACDEWIWEREEILKDFKVVSVSHSLSSFGIASILVFFETTTQPTEESLKTTLVGTNEKVKGSHFMD